MHTWRRGTVSEPDTAGGNRRYDYPAHDERAAVAPPFRASIALTEFLNAFSKTPLPMVPSTKPSSRPLRFLPSRTTATSMSVKPSGRRVKATAALLIGVVL